MKDLARRLLRLEGGTPSDSMVPDPQAALASKMQTAILACWKGNYDGREALASAHARALGYDFQEYKQAFASPDFKVIERHNQAWAEFLAENGVGPNSPSDKRDAFLAQMLERVPEQVLQGIEQEVEALKRLNSGPDRVSPSTQIADGGLLQ